MRIDSRNPVAWDELNSRIRMHLKCHSKVLVYPGLHHALFETCLGLHMRFPAKRRIYAELGFGDHLKNIEVELAKKGVRLKAGMDDEFEEKSVLTYIHDFDDALTAELYNHMETLKGISQTKVFRIHLAHHMFHFNRKFTTSLTDFDICICSLDRRYALVFYGEKVNLPHLAVTELAWDQADEKNILELIDRPAEQYREAIAGFESSLPSGVVPWFDKFPYPRLYDRALVSLKNHDGAAFVELFRQKFNSAEIPLGEHAPLESVSYCRWHNDSWFQQAVTMGRTAEDLQGLVAIDGCIINESFKKQFSQVLEELNQLSQ
ncbi:MAG: hypothetical protein KDD33_00870 [Bdellovibrionales bacterium]|nr:hypothetical protein [Bdellovibrionales bacterium]